MTVENHFHFNKSKKLKLIKKSSEQLGIPDTHYSATVKLASSEYRRICTDLSALGDTVTIEVSKEGMKFQVEGDIGRGNITLFTSIKRRK